MKRIALMLLIMTVMVSVAAFGQWTFVKVFPDSTYAKGTGGHGIAVDPEGKVWFQFFGATDSVDTGGGVFASTRVIHAFHPDGTPASFSPIKIVNYGTGTDTLTNSNRGLRADHEGNILASSFDRLYRINYMTGAGMAMVEPIDGQTLDAVDVTQDGDIIVDFVLPGNPVKIYDKDFNALGNVVDTMDAFSRTVAVSKDGNDVYVCRFTVYAVTKWHSDNGTFGPYGAPDTLMKGLSVESTAWEPGTSNLWVGSGFPGQVNAYPGTTTYWTGNAWYAYNTVSGTIVDSLHWNNVTDAGNERPRGQAFSLSGDTTWVIQFGTSAVPAVQMFVRSSVLSVQRIDDALPQGFALEQNFPNPFNPTTEIQFSIGKAGFTTVRVYDMLGREVAQLVNEQLQSGTYTATFDAAQLPSGTYVYEVVSGDVRLTKKMMLLK